LIKVNEVIAFREVILFLYALNYLFSAALMYNGLEKFQFYPMKLDEETYFTYTIPAVLLLHVGVYRIPTFIFAPKPEVMKRYAFFSVQHLKIVIVGGILLRLFSFVLPAELAFLAYLISLLRYIGAFGLMVLDIKKNSYWIAAVYLFEISQALAAGMFHDMVMWLFFTGLLLAYLLKPSMSQKISFLLVGVIAVFILQLTKSEYRSNLHKNESGVAVFAESVSNVKGKNEKGFFTKENFAQSLTRVNQGWILASTVHNMDRRKDFQRWELLKIYAEAAFLPRFLAPNKLKAGDKEIFNKYSGQKIDADTSMGLGIMADGYVSFESKGLWGAALLYGLIFALIFKRVEKWAYYSPFFVFLIFPILNYAIRPDCETQVTLGHIVKS
ncbi:MAG: hypothetical protein ACOVNR_10325, partial [Chitinophagaceae bacterium]